MAEGGSRILVVEDEPIKGSILEENMARTVGSVGEALAAGAIFVLPAFLLAGVWK